MKRTLIYGFATKMALIFAWTACDAQQTGSITVGGDLDTFYPVSWSDGGWSSNRETELHIGRSSAHINSQWRGAMMAVFNFHTTSWGNTANFINAHIASFRGSTSTPARNFIAGWQDVTAGNSDRKIVIWLRGGGTTYHYQASFAVDPVVYDGVQHALPYTTSNGSASYNVKTTEDAYVNHAGMTLGQTLRVRGTGNSVIMGNVGIGTDNPQAKLAVNGNIRATEVKVKNDIAVPDYVFEPDYDLPELSEIAAYIKEHKHLPEIPSAKDIEKDGLDLAEMNLLLLKKVEELTLHLIKLDGEKKDLQHQVNELKTVVTRIERSSNP